MKLLSLLRRIGTGYLAIELTGVLLVLPLLIGGLAGVDAILLTHDRVTVLVVLVAGIAGGYVLAIPASRLPLRLLRKAIKG